MKSYTRKRILTVSIFTSLFILYLSFRFQYIIKNRDGYVDEVQGIEQPKSLRARCKSAMPIKIIFNADLSYTETALLLIEKRSWAINQYNLCGNRVINACTEGKCGSMDLRKFIIGYFDEQKTLAAEGDERAVLKQRICVNSDESLFRNQVIYDFVEDEKKSILSTDHEQQLKAFGAMLSMAIALEVFLEIEFEKHFLTTSYDTKDLLYSLKFVDKEQYDLYLRIKWRKLCFYRRLNSPKPFTDYCSPFENDGCEKTKTDDTGLSSAATQIFITPYLRSREIVFKQMELVLGTKLYNKIEYFMHSNHVYLNELFNGSSYNPVSLYQWKRNSSYSFSGRIFWKALLELDSNQKMEIYYKITGCTKVPRGGMRRLPLTQIVMGEGEMFPDRFVVVINPSWDVNEVKLHLQMYK